MEHVIVEGRYPEPTTPEAVIERGRGQRFCFDLYRSHPVTHYLALDGVNMCCVFRAPDAELVRRALAKIGVLPPDRVWTASLEGRDGDMADLARAASLAAGSEALVWSSATSPNPSISPRSRRWRTPAAGASISTMSAFSARSSPRTAGG